MANENNKMLAQMVINRIKNLVPNANAELVQRPIGSDKDGVWIRFNLGSLSPEIRVTEDIQDLLSSSDDDFLEWYYNILEEASSSQPESSFIDWVNSLAWKKEDILPYLIPRVRRAGIEDSCVREPLCYGIDVLLYIVNSDYPDYGIPLTENMAKELKLNIPEVFNYVREKRFEYFAENVVDVLRNAGIPIPDDDTMLPLIVVSLTNDGDRMPHGAGVLASRSCMKELEDRFGDLIIFPSSIHEILVVPRRALGMIKNRNDLTEMVRDINASTVKPFEQLADNVYLYHDGELSVF